MYDQLPARYPLSTAGTATNTQQSPSVDSDVSASRSTLIRRSWIRSGDVRSCATPVVLYVGADIEAAVDRIDRRAA